MYSSIEGRSISKKRVILSPAPEPWLLSLPKQSKGGEECITLRNQVV